MPPTPSASGTGTIALRMGPAAGPSHGPNASVFGLDEVSGGGRVQSVALLRERIARIEGTHLHRLDAGPLDARAAPPPDPQAGPRTSPPHGLNETLPAPVRDARAAAALPIGARPSILEGKPSPPALPAMPARDRKRRRVIPLGLQGPDAALAGGFPAEGLTEVHVDETRGSGAGAGFALALAVLSSAGLRRPALWIGEGLAFSEAGFPYLPGLAGHGLDPGGLLVVRTDRLEQALWAGEEAARSAALSLVILEVRGNPGRLSLEGTRRLHFRAREAGIPLVLLRQGGQAEATAAPFRLRVAPGRAGGVRDVADERLIGSPVFSVRIEKSPAGRPNSFLLEWNPHERRFQEPLPAATGPSSAFPDHGRQPAAPVDRPDPAREARPLMAFRRAS